LGGRGVGEVGEEEAGGEEAAVFGRAATFIAGRWVSRWERLVNVHGMLMGEFCRFAAKEAAFKAHPHLHLGFHDIVILPSSDADELTGEKALTGLPSSAPVALIRGEGEGARDQMAKVSISHDGEYATAMCIGFEASGGGHDRRLRKGWFTNFFKIWS
jgi:phosphopantetheinyl transferase (holo-ACP synthase)